MLYLMQKILSCWPVNVNYHFNPKSYYDENVNYHSTTDNKRGTNFKGLLYSKNKSEHLFYKNVSILKMGYFHFTSQASLNLWEPH